MCLKKVTGSVLVLNLLAQVFKACFAHAEAASVKNSTDSYFGIYAYDHLTIDLK